MALPLRYPVIGSHSSIEKACNALNRIIKYFNDYGDEIRAYQKDSPGSSIYDDALIYLDRWIAGCTAYKVDGTPSLLEHSNMLDYIRNFKILMYPGIEATRKDCRRHHKLVVLAKVLKEV